MVWFQILFSVIGSEQNLGELGIETCSNSGSSSRGMIHFFVMKQRIVQLISQLMWIRACIGFAYISFDSGSDSDLLLWTDAMAESIKCDIHGKKVLL